jgi:type IV pilus assembly protein PilB
MQLGQILLRKQLVSSQQLEQVLQEQTTKRRRLGELLLEHSLISSEDLALTLLEQQWRQRGYWVID